jgi:hypothetical protein
MKGEVIPYDSMYWEINNTQASGEKSQTKPSGSKTTNTQQERSKSQTPNVKTENAKTGTTTQQFLHQEEFEECKKN